MFGNARTATTCGGIVTGRERKARREAGNRSSTLPMCNPTGALQSSRFGPAGLPAAAGGYSLP